MQFSLEFIENFGRSVLDRLDALLRELKLEDRHQQGASRRNPENSGYFTRVAREFWEKLKNSTDVESPSLQKSKAAQLRCIEDSVGEEIASNSNSMRIKSDQLFNGASLVVLYGVVKGLVKWSWERFGNSTEFATESGKMDHQKEVWATKN